MEEGGKQPPYLPSAPKGRDLSDWRHTSHLPSEDHSAGQAPLLGGSLRAPGRGSPLTGPRQGGIRLSCYDQKQICARCFSRKGGGSFGKPDRVRISSGGKGTGTEREGKGRVPRPCCPVPSRRASYHAKAPSAAARPVRTFDEGEVREQLQLSADVHLEVAEGRTGCRAEDLEGVGRPDDPAGGVWGLVEGKRGSGKEGQFPKADPRPAVLASLASSGRWALRFPSP